MTSKNIEEFLNFLRQCEQEYSMAQADYQDTNDETQDILHSLELESHTYHEYANLSKRLAEVRKRRRQAKDKIAVMEPIVCFCEENKAFIKSTERLLGDVRKAEKKLENRVYTPRKK